MAKKVCDRVLAVRATQAESELIQALAKLEGKTPSSLMRTLLARAVADRFAALAANGQEAQ